MKKFLSIIFGIVWIIIIPIYIIAMIFVSIRIEMLLPALLTRISNGGVIIQNGKVDECNAKIKELEEMPVEDNGDIKFALDELAPINFSINEMLSLECYIEQ